MEAAHGRPSALIDAKSVRVPTAPVVDSHARAVNFLLNFSAMYPKNSSERRTLQLAINTIATQSSEARASTIDQTMDYFGTEGRVADNGMLNALRRHLGQVSRAFELSNTTQLVC